MAEAINKFRNPGAGKTQNYYGRKTLHEHIINENSDCLIFLGKSVEFQNKIDVETAEMAKKKMYDNMRKFSQVGAAAGSVIPFLGNGVGAAIGALSGFLTNVFDKPEKKRIYKMFNNQIKNTFENSFDYQVSTDFANTFSHNTAGLTVENALFFNPININTPLTLTQGQSLLNFLKESYSGTPFETAVKSIRISQNISDDEIILFMAKENNSVPNNNNQNNSDKNNNAAVVAAIIAGVGYAIL